MAVTAKRIGEGWGLGREGGGCFKGGRGRQVCGWKGIGVVEWRGWVEGWSGGGGGDGWRGGWVEGTGMGGWKGGSLKGAGVGG